MYNSVFNGSIASTSNNTTWNIIEPWPNIASGVGYDYNSTYTSTTGSALNTVELNIKRCRNCHHAHIEGQSGCIEALHGNVTFRSCSCEEYVPSDNLEYLEYLDKKKDNK